MHPEEKPAPFKIGGLDLPMARGPKSGLRQPQPNPTPEVFSTGDGKLLAFAVLVSTLINCLEILRFRQMLTLGIEEPRSKVVSGFVRKGVNPRLMFQRNPKRGWGGHGGTCHRLDVERMLGVFNLGVICGGQKA